MNHVPVTIDRPLLYDTSIISSSVMLKTMYSNTGLKWKDYYVRLIGFLFTYPRGFLFVLGLEFFLFVFFYQVICSNPRASSAKLLPDQFLYAALCPCLTFPKHKTLCLPLEGIFALYLEGFGVCLQTAFCRLRNTS